METTKRSGADASAAYHPLTLEIMDLVGDKWTLLITYTLGEGPQRFAELKRRASPISAKMLSQTLRGLECYGMVSRTVAPTSPPSVEYALTPLGASFLDAASVICAWTKNNMEELAAARQAFNAEQAAA